MILHVHINIENCGGYTLDREHNLLGNIYYHMYHIEAAKGKKGKKLKAEISTLNENYKKQLVEVVKMDLNKNDYMTQHDYAIYLTQQVNKLLEVKAE
jgi:hypothetical protein